MQDPIENSPAPEPRSSSQTINLSMGFTGHGIEYFILVLKTTLLTLLTFGLYYPWARCARLHYIYKNITVGGQKLSFHATGKEIAIGYLKAIVIYGSIYAFLLYSQSVSKELPLISLLAVILFYLTLPAAIWGSRAFRATRLSFRGIRFGMDRQFFKPFVLSTVGEMVITGMTLGIYAPFAMYKLKKRLTDCTLWGNQKFHFEPSKEESVWMSYSNFVMSILSMGLLYPYALIRRLSFDIDKTRIQGTRAQSNFKWYDGYVLMIFPLLVSTVSLGLFYPWSQVFQLRYLYSRIRFEGEFDLGKVIQNLDLGSAVGETMGSMLDIDSGIGV